MAVGIRWAFSLSGSLPLIAPGVPPSNISHGPGGSQPSNKLVFYTNPHLFRVPGVAQGREPIFYIQWGREKKPRKRRDEEPLNFLLILLLQKKNLRSRPPTLASTCAECLIAGAHGSTANEIIITSSFIKYRRNPFASTLRFVGAGGRAAKRMGVHYWGTGMRWRRVMRVKLCMSWIWMCSSTFPLSWAPYLLWQAAETIQDELVGTKRELRARTLNVMNSP